MAIDPTIRARIDTLLDDIERREGIRYLLAIESGSRAWGFPSPDSDYDVRFVYVRPLDWYLSLEPGRDVIEEPVDAVMDANGWDLRKALSLLLKPNAVLLEWLQSPIRYRWNAPACAMLTALAEKVAHGPGCLHHYHHLGRRQWRRHIADRETVNLKRYFYVARPAMAIRWIRANPGKVPPMDFATLRNGADLSPALTAELDRLIVVKSRASESGEGARIGVLDDFILSEMAWAACEAKTIPKPDADLRAGADDVFRSIVKEYGPHTI